MTVIDARRVPSAPPLAPPSGPEPRVETDELLDESRGLLGMGRSTTFPFPQYRAADAFRTVYFDAGAGARPLVFVHGLGANATHFEHIASYFGKRTRVLGLDLVGCGSSEKPRRPYTLDLLTGHLLDFLEARGVERAVLVGHSLGGAVCLDAALRHPDRFDGLVLLGAAGVAKLPSWMHLAGPVFLRYEVLYPFLRFGHPFILENVFVDSAEENPFVRHFHQMALRDEPGYRHLKDFARVCGSLCRDLLGRDFSGQIPSLPMPILGLWGRADKLTPVREIERSLARARSARLVFLDRCGHMPMIEKPREVLYQMERFLRELPTTEFPDTQ
jgi:2-hydroxy-6-oxonona-2,4-dienedioate hydrolase